jgi:hypothetical protein
MIQNPWQIQIQGWASDLEHLALHTASKSRRIVRDEKNSNFLYESNSFDACMESVEVLKIANEELSVLSGVLKLTRNSHEVLKTSAVYKKNATGGKDVFVHLHESLQIHVEIGEVTVTITDPDGRITTRPSPQPRTITIAELAIVDPAVAKTLRLVADPNFKSWVNLYRIHEVIDKDVGGENALKNKGWGSESDLKRFKHSANSVSVAGDLARHGKEDSLPPKNPMSIDEAAAYLNYVLESWITSKNS